MAAQALSAVGPGAPVAIMRPGVPALPPSVLCMVSNGASLTYSVEVSADPPGFTPAVWFPLDSTAVGLTGSQNFALSSQVWWVRANVTSYTSGSLSFEVGQ